MIRQSFLRPLYAALIVTMSCMPAPAVSAQGRAAAEPQAAQPRPTLVVMLTIDQLRPDYLTLYEKQFTGGFARLLRGGAVFLNGFQDHANTETAPGHASVLSGRFPRSTGIVSNSAGVYDQQFPLVGARGDPRIAAPFFPSAAHNSQHTGLRAAPDALPRASITPIHCRPGYRRSTTAGSHISGPASRGTSCSTRRNTRNLTPW